MVIANSGQITASQEFSGLFPDPDSDKYALRLVKEAGEDMTIAFTNASGGTISTNADNALVLAGFNGANDNVTFSNEGSISATQDNAVDLSNSNFHQLAMTAFYHRRRQLRAAARRFFRRQHGDFKSWGLSRREQPNRAMHRLPFMALSQPLSIRFQSPRAHHPLLVRSVIR